MMCDISYIYRSIEKRTDFRQGHPLDPAEAAGTGFGKGSGKPCGTVGFFMYRD